MKYNDFEVFEFSFEIVQTKKLVETSVDSENWRVLYQNRNSNWIKFYPFSKEHGGGQPYIINIKSRDFELFLKDYSDFVESIRKDILNSKFK